MSRIEYKNHGKVILKKRKSTKLESKEKGFQD
jgi:hypothetical protein